MASAFDTNFANIAGNFRSIFGDAVSIRRGSSTTPDVTAQKLLGLREVEDDGDIDAVSTRTSVVHCDWIVAKSAYLISSVATRPRRGDRIIESDGTQWEVLPTSDGDESSELPGGIEWLVRTKEV